MDLLSRVQSALLSAQSVVESLEAIKMELMVPAEPLKFPPVEGASMPDISVPTLAEILKLPMGHPPIASRVSAFSIRLRQMWAAYGRFKEELVAIAGNETLAGLEVQATDVRALLNHLGATK